jgi:hypothetical protein
MAFLVAWQDFAKMGAICAETPQKGALWPAYKFSFYADEEGLGDAELVTHLSVVDGSCRVRVVVPPVAFVDGSPEHTYFTKLMTLVTRAAERADFTLTLALKAHSAPQSLYSAPVLG